ncbi:unnamed protein product [Aphis gossypii]|uniref:SAM domain-containing protein n=1 Tax=Aphis gossypii TaxID=80765 RepID=A0A9P0NPN8_APHGO|nr:unnamed protein product [Aphis gossypii]
MEKSDENIKIIEDVDSFENRDSLLYSDYDNTSKTDFQCDLTLDNESLMVIEDDDDDDDDDNGGDSLSDVSNCEIIDERKELNIPTSIKIPEQKNTLNDDFEDESEDDSDAEIYNYKQTIAINKKIVSTAAIKNTKQKENNSLNVKKLFISKNDSSFSKLNPLVKSNQIKLTSVATINNPKTKSLDLQPELSSNKKFGHKDVYKLTSSKDSSSDFLIIPHNGMNYMITKNTPKRNSSMKSLSSTLKIPSTIVKPNEQNKQCTVMSSSFEKIEESNSVARMQQHHSEKCKMVPDQEQLPINLERVFKRNSNFIKQKIATNPTSNGHKVGDFFHRGNSYQFVNTRETKNVQRKIVPTASSIKSALSRISTTIDLTDDIKNKKAIPHTATSKNSSSFIKKSNIYRQRRSPSKSPIMTGIIDLSSDSPPLSSSECDEITKNDHKTIKSSSLDSFNKSKTKFNYFKMLKNGANDSNGLSDEILDANSCETSTSKNLHMRQAVKKKSNKNKVLLSQEVINLSDLSDSSNEENNDTSDQFISCKYEYCDTLVYEPELIDDLYCSLACKNLDLEKIRTEEENVVDKTTNLSKTSTVNRKHVLSKLENRINKRKQLLTSSCPDDLIKENDDFDKQLINFFNKPSVEENQSSLKLSKPISSVEAVVDDNGYDVDDDDDDDEDDDDDDDDDYFDLKPLIEDKDVLKYMIGMQFKSAPKKLFDRPFPSEKNLFVVGQKLEGIDPKHEALFCVMTVSEVCGYRIKLHFDGYPDDYDFWVNADCPNLFHPGWCEMNSRILQPPNNYENEFNWISYLRECQALPAPKHNFVSTKSINNYENQHKFHIGDKLEALDKLTRTLPKQLICVATVADILGNRIRIHFDGWTDDFDYWTDITSTNIHPIRWCDYNGRILSPPSGYNDMKGKKPFNWTEYLKETNSNPVPEDAFVRRPLRDFSNKMTIEVVDLVVPRLLRIARVVDVRGDELKIVYDGFDDNYAYWVEDDSPDIHPVGWSAKTNHPIELPPAPNKLWNCHILGCKGYGNSSNRLKNDHNELRDCPYEMDSWKTAVAGLGKMPDRLKANNVLITTKLTSSKSKSNIHQANEKKKKKKPNTEYNNLFKIKEKINEKSNIPSSNNNNLRKALGLSLVGYNLGSIYMEQQCNYWTRHNAQLGIPLFNTTDARTWSVQEVASYVKKVVETNTSKSSNTNEEISISDRFINQEIDGESFLMLNQDDIMNILKVPLGHALKLTNAIILLRQRSFGIDLFDNLPQH